MRKPGWSKISAAKAKRIDRAVRRAYGDASGPALDGVLAAIADEEGVSEWYLGAVRRRQQRRERTRSPSGRYYPRRRTRGRSR